jgi:hypothetical protein
MRGAYPRGIGTNVVRPTLRIAAVRVSRRGWCVTADRIGCPGFDISARRNQHRARGNIKVETDIGRSTVRWRSSTNRTRRRCADPCGAERRRVLLILQAESSASRLDSAGARTPIDIIVERMRVLTCPATGFVGGQRVAASQGRMALARYLMALTDAAVMLAGRIATEKFGPPCARNRRGGLSNSLFGNAAEVRCYCAGSVDLRAARPETYAALPD